MILMKSWNIYFLIQYQCIRGGGRYVFIEYNILLVIILLYNIYIALYSCTACSKALQNFVDLFCHWDNFAILSMVIGLYNFIVV